MMIIYVRLLGVLTHARVMKCFLLLLLLNGAALRNTVEAPRSPRSESLYVTVTRGLRLWALLA